MNTYQILCVKCQSNAIGIIDKKDMGGETIETTHSMPGTFYKSGDLVRREFKIFYKCTKYNYTGDEMRYKEAWEQN